MSVQSMSMKLIIAFCLVNAHAARLESSYNYDDKPVHWCKLEDEEYCVFRNVQMTLENPRFQPAAENISTIKKVKFLTSILPVITDDICNAFPALEILWIDSTGIEEIHEDAFNNCKRILQILVRENKIKHIYKDTFRHTTTMNRIYLNSNEIEELDVSVFSSMKFIRFFQLENNRLKSFPIDLVKDNPELKEIYLTGNDLLDIDYVELINSVPSLKLIGYNDNEISCKKVAAMNAAFTAKGIEVYMHNYARKRYYPQEKVDDILCSPDISWSASHYRKIKEHEVESNVCPVDSTVIQRLEERMENLEKLMQDMMKLMVKGL